MFFLCFLLLYNLSGQFYFIVLYDEDTICVFSQKKVFVIYCSCVYYYRVRRGVAQPGRVLAWGARGRKFESCHPDHKN